VLLPDLPLPAYNPAIDGKTFIDLVANELGAV